MPHHHRTGGVDSHRCFPKPDSGRWSRGQELGGRNRGLLRAGLMPCVAWMGEGWIGEGWSQPDQRWFVRQAASSDSVSSPPWATKTFHHPRRSGVDFHPTPTAYLFSGRRMLERMYGDRRSAYPTQRILPRPSRPSIERRMFHMASASQTPDGCTRGRIDHPSWCGELLRRHDGEKGVRRRWMWSMA
jgi:hypothetical protein